MRYVSLRQVCLLLGCLLFFTSYSTDLPVALQNIIKRSPIPADDISIWISSVDSAKPLVDYHSHISRPPASTTKIITTGVALLLLGKDFRWPTSFYTDGKIERGHITGNLYIRGYGNPYMVKDSLQAMIAQLRHANISHIDGKVILDSSYFNNIQQNPNAFDGHGLEAYNAIPNALSIDFRTITIRINANKNAIELTTEPKLYHTKLINHLSFSQAKQCRGEGYKPRITVDNLQEIVTISGTISPSCKNRRLKAVIADAGDLFFAHFKEGWELSGGSVGNDWQYGHIDKYLSLLYQGLSKPLQKQIVPMNKLSNNLMARQLFLTIGAEILAPPATLDKSRWAVIDKLREIGLSVNNLFIDNGSGLSRKTHISAEQFGQFLLFMHHSKAAPYFKRSLSIVGVDGTLKQRLKGTPLAGNAIGKSGALNNAKSIAGYLSAKNGRLYAYVILLEGKRARTGRPLMDEIMKWIYNIT